MSGLEPPPWGSRRAVAFVGGRKDGHWVFLDDYEQLARSAQLMGTPWPYELTERTIVHPRYNATGSIAEHRPVKRRG